MARLTEAQVAVLRLVAKSRPESVTVATITKRIGMSKPTAHRVVRTLLDDRLLENSSNSGNELGQPRTGRPSLPVTISKLGLEALTEYHDALLRQASELQKALGANGPESPGEQR